MPKAAITRSTRSSRERVVRRQPARSLPARASKAPPTKAPATKAPGPKQRQPVRAQASKDAPEAPSLDIEKLYDDCTVPGHEYRFDNLNTPQFAAASKRLAQALKGKTPARAAPPVYSSIYSYLPAYCRIEEGTPVAPGAFPQAYAGTAQACQPMLWTEDEVNIVLKAEFGDVEMGHRFMREMASVSDVVGGSPDPEDSSIRTIPIPDQTYYMRLWTGHMDQQKTVCWQLMSNKTHKPMVRPEELTIYDITEGHERMALPSLEGCWRIEKEGSGPVPRGVGETFAATDGAIVEFVVRGQPIFRIRLPARPTRGPPRIKKYREYKILPLEDEEGSSEEDESEGEAD
ncbi:hypothetical protein EV715DRAFT_292786 [Schizophyllum commune]